MAREPGQRCLPRAPLPRFASLTPDTEEVDVKQLAELITPRTKLVSLVHVSNMLGCTLPAARVSEMAHAVGAKLLLDCCQSGAPELWPLELLRGARGQAACGAAGDDAPLTLCARACSAQHACGRPDSGGRFYRSLRAQDVRAHRHRVFVGQVRASCSPGCTTAREHQHLSHHPAP